MKRSWVQPPAAALATTPGRKPLAPGPGQECLFSIHAEGTMAKEVFQRTKPHVNVGTIGHIDHGKTTLTAAIVARQAFMNKVAKFKDYNEIAKGGTERDELKTVTLAVAHVEYETPNRHYA